MVAEILQAPNAIWVEREDRASILRVPLEMLVLAFAHSRRAEEALRELNALRQDRELQLEHAAVLARDAHGKGACRESDDGAGGAVPSERVRGAVMRLLPGPLSVLTGGSARDALGAASPGDWTFQDWDPVRLARYLAVESSVLMLLIERQWVGELMELISRVAIALRSPRLQVTLDETVERLMAQRDEE
jgi:uncharacterized membrane protein